MKCSVIILNWNGAGMLRQFLPSVVKYTANPEYEVVVADNGSTDESMEVLKDFPTVRIITFDKNYGFAEGYNKALEKTDAEYTVLLNSDVEVTEKWLTTLLDYMDEHQEVAACQPKILAYHKKTHFEHAGAAGGYIDILGYPYCRGRIMGYVEEDKGQYDTIADIFWATGACLCIRTKVYKEEGGLDADFFAHMEEIDLCWRLNSRGYKLVCIPQSVVYHVGGGALSYENPRKTFLNFRNNLLLLYKNLPFKRLWWVMILRFALDYVAALQYLVTGKTKNAKAVVDARMAYHKMQKEFAEKREENLSKAKVDIPQSISNRSIIFDYHIKGMRK